MPPGQSLQAASALARIVELHFPASQRVHFVLSAFEYDPAAHGAQVDPGAVDTVPASQGSQKRLPASPGAASDICFPAGHTLQNVCPAMLLVCFPASHALHLVCLESALYESGAQSAQRELAFAPALSLALPGGQSLH